MDQKTYNALIVGMIIGYLIRHFFPPKEMTIRGWIVTGIIGVFILILIYVNIKDLKRKK